MAKKADIFEQNKDRGIIEMTMEEVMHNSMMPYSEHVILDRALPRVEDGLKPVQRRILYAMNELGVTPDKPYRKCARIVGDVLGKYHPHGDSSVYGALVVLAQDFKQRHTLVDGHGNFGSIDGDPAAAQRYTEARLMPLASELLRDIDKDTVHWNLNFDDTLKEPDTLPGRYPNLLVNGSYGIAVGLATNIPPHNLGEVIDGVIAYIDNPRITLSEMMKIIKGPDFPTGGYLVCGDELYTAYETGRGKVMMYPKIHIEIGDNDRRNIVITELPYGVNKKVLLEAIDAVQNEKKGKEKDKSKNVLSFIADIADESDRNGMRAVIKVKKDGDPKAICEALFKSTSLATSFGINMVAIADGKPQQMGLMDIIAYYVDYQRDVIIRRTRYDLNQAKDREHILEGLLTAIRAIDEVVAIIKKAASQAEAKVELRKAFDLSEKQAQAVLDLRLGRLTHLDVFKLEGDVKELRAQIARYNEILASKREQMNVIKTEISLIKKNYKDGRRTVVIDRKEDYYIPSADDAKPVENAMIAYSLAGGLKRIPMRSFGSAARDFSEKTTVNDICYLLEPAKTDQLLYCFTDQGNCYKIDVDAIPEARWRDKGVSLASLMNCSADERIVKIFVVDEKLPSGKLMFFTKEGYIKQTEWKEYNVVKSAFQAIKLKEGDLCIGVEQEQKGSTMLFVTASGMCLNTDRSDVPDQGRVAGGVHGIKLDDGDCVVCARQVQPDDEICLVTDRAYAKRVKAKDIDVMVRYRKGVKIIDFKDGNGSSIAYATTIERPENIVIRVTGNYFMQFNSEDLHLEKRTTKGRAICKLSRHDSVEAGCFYKS